MLPKLQSSNKLLLVKHICSCCYCVWQHISSVISQKHANFCWE